MAQLFGQGVILLGIIAIHTIAVNYYFKTRKANVVLIKKLYYCTLNHSYYETDNALFDNPSSVIWLQQHTNKP